MATTIADPKVIREILYNTELNELLPPPASDILQNFDKYWKHLAALHQLYQDIQFSGIPKIGKLYVNYVMPVSKMETPIAIDYINSHFPKELHVSLHQVKMIYLVAVLWQGYMMQNIQVPEDSNDFIYNAEDALERT